MNIVSQQLNHALKEWAIAVDALTTGKTIILLRKGGIREADFQIKHPLVWLYPTHEHQKPELLKPEYVAHAKPVESGWHPEQVIIKSCAEITDIFYVDNQSQEALQPYHIWRDRLVSDRFNWKPQQPLKVLLLKVYYLPTPHKIPFDKTYGGCKSWIDLVEPIATDNLSPVLENREYEQKVQQIKHSIGNANNDNSLKK